MNTPTNRDTQIDALKGFLVLLMAVGHIPYSFFNIDKPGVINTLSSWIYFFHMPLFLVISVLFIKTNLIWLSKRALLILGPYLFWFVFAQKKLLWSDPLKLFGDALWGNWNTLHSTLWFLPALFSLNLLVFLFYRSGTYARSLMLAISLGCFILARYIVAWHAHIPFGIDIAFYLLLLAVIIKTLYTYKETCRRVNARILLVVIALSSIALFYLEPVKMHSPFHAIIDMAQFSVAMTIPGYLAFITLSAAIFILFLKLPELKPFSVLGAYSFPVFLLHLKILYEAPKLIRFDSLILNILFMALTFCLAILLPVWISKGLMRISEKFKYIGMVK